MGDVSLSIQAGKGSHEQPLLRETLSVISFWCQGTPSYVITGVPFCPPVEPGGYHSLGRGQAACLCRGGGGTAMAVAEGCWQCHMGKYLLLDTQFQLPGVLRHP